MIYEISLSYRIHVEIIMKVIKSLKQQFSQGWRRFQQNVGKSRAVYMALVMVMSVGACWHNLGMPKLAVAIIVLLLVGLFTTIVCVCLEPVENIFDAIGASFFLGFFALLYVSTAQSIQPVALDQFSSRLIIYVCAFALSAFLRLCAV